MTPTIALPVLFFVLCLAPAHAQQKDANKEVELHVTVAEAQFIINQLALAPWKEVNSLIVKLAEQVKKQLAPSEEPDKPK